MRTLPLAALVAVPALVLGLAACTPEAPAETPDTAGTDTPTACAPSGPMSEAVEVSGDFDTTPTVTFPAPLSVTATQRTVLIEGGGSEVQDGALTQIHFTLYNGESGALASSTEYDPSTLVPFSIVESSLPGLVQTLRCSTVGSRVVGVVPASAAWGDEGFPQLQIGPGQPLVFVADLVGVLPTQAEGESSPLPDGFPEVSWADDGQPTVTIPDADPPAELKVATVITGTGATVAADESLLVQYQGVNWTTGEVFDESWGRAPATFSTAPGALIDGFTTALVGQTVGSRIVVIIPPDQGYGPIGGQPDAGISATDTLVFVIDILATQPG